MKAWLFRKGKTAWEFEPCPIHRCLVHRTRNGTVYSIRSYIEGGKPFWIGRLGVSIRGGEYWYTCEQTLRAQRIVFEDAGEYVFPG
jgi:predicted NUDIX family NTP pyrophosphohydrolase